MRIVMMGTPEFSVPALEALARAGHEITAAVTQPDRPRGRGKAMQPTPVKECAVRLGIPVLTPEKVRGNADFLARLREADPEVIVVAAYGQILDRPVLTLPRYGCINIHASLLPKYRGAAPIQWAVINGETVSGVTTMQMNEGLDTGDILEQKAIPLSAGETGGSLSDKLAEAGGELILQTLEKLERHELTPIPQRGETNYVGMITKEMGEIDWKKPAAAVERLIRGLDPWPSAYTYLEGKTLKIWKAREEASVPESAAPGEIVRAGKDCFTVRCGEGGLSVLELQLEGKKRMDCAAFLRGYPLREGTLLGR